MKESNPKCRKCGIDATDVPEFKEFAKVHNEREGQSMQVDASVYGYGPGSHYDPSNNTFICPKCKGGTK